MRLSILAQSVWIRGAATVAILAYLVSRIDMPATGRALLSIDVRYLILAIFLVAADRIGMILRWILLLRSSGQPVSAKSAAWIHMVSSFVGSVLPAGVGGDVARAYALSKRTTQGSEAVASVAVDRLVGVASIAVMGVLGAMAWMLRQGDAPQVVLLRARQHAAPDGRGRGRRRVARALRVVDRAAQPQLLGRPGLGQVRQVPCHPMKDCRYWYSHAGRQSPNRRDC